jgi:hypothetical protein
VSGDLSLFGDDQPVEPVKPVPTEGPIADWLVDHLREALDARGLMTMAIVSRRLKPLPSGPWNPCGRGPVRRRCASLSV